MSTKSPPFTRQDAIRELDRHGIRGAHTYLIDVLPLIEMMWADGIVQTVERDLLEKFLRNHVDNLNALVGYSAIHYDDSASFVERFLSERPSAEMLGVLRKLIPTVGLRSTDVKRNTQQRRAIVRWCLDIGAACVTDYPYGDHDRFSEAEKACFEEIVASLGDD
ncbi:MAG: hypothetical protein H0T42_28935 [Deltaproteobacteria bacterium]|nr:hypothetical protein [Deltaproteobacteria bacterium]